MYKADVNLASWQKTFMASLIGHSSPDGSDGTGIKQIEKTLLPLYAGLRWDITRSNHVALFLEGQCGYSFALSPGSSGGNLWGGFFGCDFPLKSKNSIALSLGYEYQGYRVLRSSHAAS